MILPVVLTVATIVPDTLKVLDQLNHRKMEMAHTLTIDDSNGL